MAHEDQRIFDLRSLLPGEYYCSGCAGRVCEAARAIEGVTDASCDLDEGVLTVLADAHALKGRDLEASITRIALEETGRVGHAAYRLTGLD